MGRAPADGTGLERVGPATPYAVVVAPSPDGSRVAYTSDFDASAVRLVDAATGATAVYARPAGGVRWSPQGGRLAIAGESGMGVLNADGTGYHALAPGSAIADYSVAWSPDGQWIAIRGRTRIELVQVATGLDIPLPFTDGYARPAWKP
jgi:Tol biopolymer transport system component